MARIYVLSIYVTMPGESSEQALEDVRQAVVGALTADGALPEPADLDIEPEWDLEEDA